MMHFYFITPYCVETRVSIVVQYGKIARQSFFGELSLEDRRVERQTQILPVQD